MTVRSRTSSMLVVGVLAGALATAGLGPALGASGGSVPDVVFLARSDVAADALAVGPVAAQMGGPVLITRPTELAEAAAQTLEDLAPDLVIVLGGEAAISSTVLVAAGEACGCSTRRVAGSTREATAAAVASLLAEFGLGGPLVAGATRDGDAGISGTLTAGQVQTDALAVTGSIQLGDGTIHLPLDGTPEQNGAALRAVIEAIPDGQPTLLQLAPGTAHLGADPLALPDGLLLRGAGSRATTLTADPADSETDAGVLRVAPGTSWDDGRQVTVVDLSLDLTSESAGYAWAGTVGLFSRLFLERVDVTVDGGGPTTATGGFTGETVHTPPSPGYCCHTYDYSMISLLHSSITINGKTGSHGAISGGHVTLSGATVRTFQPGAVPAIAGHAAIVDDSVLYSSGSGSMAIEVARRAIITGSRVGNVRSTDGDLRVTSSTVHDIDAHEDVHLSASLVTGTVGHGTCTGTFGPLNQLLPPSCDGN